MADPMALLGYLTEELGKLFDDALLVEPAGGVNDAWAKVLAGYGVAPIGAAERERLRAQLNLARGALPGEVAACAHAIARRFADAVGEPRLVAAAEEVWRTTEATYLKHATWRPKSMFAFAVQSAKTAKSKGWQRPPGGFVIRCSQCGGPRLAEELACQFCGKDKLGT
ncbi:MAG: hypothetical protein IPQ07_30900 [Myxococcales bacterium]|nr:hypothetical protein [Myxococcales bacterium]